MAFKLIIHAADLQYIQVKKELMQFRAEKTAEHIKAMDVSFDLLAEVIALLSTVHKPVVEEVS